MSEASYDLLLDNFRLTITGPDEDVDLIRAGLALSYFEYPELEIEPILEGVDALAAQVAHRIDGNPDPARQIEILNQVVIHGMGLRAAREDYYDPRNSFISQTLERKTGIPISLSVIYMGIGARAGIPLAGTSMPMHFLVRVLGVRPPMFVDCYNGGQVLTEEVCRQAVRVMSNGVIEFRPEMLDPVSNLDVIARLLTNLKMIYLNQLQFDKARSILDRLLTISPESAPLLRERGLVLYRLGERDLARRDLSDYLAADDKAPDITEIRNILKRIG